MKVTIDIPNDVTRGKALSGSLYVDNDGNANMRFWNIRPKKTSIYKRLSHGKVSLNMSKTRLTLSVNHDEGVDAVKAIMEESLEARDWLLNKNV